MPCAPVGGDPVVLDRDAPSSGRRDPGAEMSGDAVRVDAAAVPADDGDAVAVAVVGDRAALDHAVRAAQDHAARGVPGHRQAPQLGVAAAAAHAHLEAAHRAVANQHVPVAVAAVAVHDPGAAARAVDRVAAQVDRHAVGRDHEADARAIAQVGVEPHVRGDALAALSAVRRRLREGARGSAARATKDAASADRGCRFARSIRGTNPLREKQWTHRTNVQSDVREKLPGTG